MACFGGSLPAADGTLAASSEKPLASSCPASALYFVSFFFFFGLILYFSFHGRKVLGHDKHAKRIKKENGKQKQTGGVVKGAVWDRIQARWTSVAGLWFRKVFILMDKMSEQHARSI